MNKTEFIENLKEVYEGDYSDLEFTEINNLLYDFTTDRIDILYDHIRDNYKYRKLPGYQYIKNSCQQLRLTKSKNVEKLPEDVRKKTPLYQLEFAKDWNSKAILEHVNFIRKKQDQLIRDGHSMLSMKSEDISFLSIWDRLRYIKLEHLEIAKQRIIESGENELYSDKKANLDDLMMPLIKIEGIENKIKLKEF